MGAGYSPSILSFSSLSNSTLLSLSVCDYYIRFLSFECGPLDFLERANAQHVINACIKVTFHLSEVVTPLSFLVEDETSKLVFEISDPP